MTLREEVWNLPLILTTMLVSTYPQPASFIYMRHDVCMPWYHTHYPPCWGFWATVCPTQYHPFYIVSRRCTVSLLINNKCCCNIFISLLSLSPMIYEMIIESLLHTLCSNVRVNLITHSSTKWAYEYHPKFLYSLYGVNFDSMLPVCGKMHVLYIPPNLLVAL